MVLVQIRQSTQLILIKNRLFLPSSIDLNFVAIDYLLQIRISFLSYFELVITSIMLRCCVIVIRIIIKSIGRGRRSSVLLLSFSVMPFEQIFLINFILGKERSVV